MAAREHKDRKEGRKGIFSLSSFTAHSWLLVLLAFASIVHAQVANPVFTPPSGTKLPVTVTITNATSGSQIYYTLDGTVPDTSSTLYASPLTFTTYTTVRAHAFKTGQTPSDTISAEYYSFLDQPTVVCQRTVTPDLPNQPLVTFLVTGTSNVTCFSIEERLPLFTQATSINSNGVFTPGPNVVRWGPFTNLPTVTVSYRLTGQAGTYSLDGAVSADGAWTFSPAISQATIAGAGAPVQPPQVATPVFTPASGSNVPVSVTITSATPGAVIYYTLDGTLPSQGSTLYAGAVSFVTAGVIRARAFTNGWTPSVASVAYYGPPAAPAAVQVARSVNTNLPTAPTITFTASPGTNTSCFALEENLPLGLGASNVTAGGVYTANSQVVRWGPFLGTNAQVLTYQAVGLPATYPVRATWSVDGTGGGEATGTNIVIAYASGNGILTPPPQVPIPVLSPATGTTLPVTVAITCSDGLAQIYFTTDGSLPTQSSTLYGGAVAVSTPSALRARAFRAGYQPSVAALGEYVAAATTNALLLVRGIVSNATFLPSITITAAPQGNVRSYAVTENIPTGLTPSNFAADAVWNPTNSTIKWGPYPDNALRLLKYQLSGFTGTYGLSGQGSFDGFPASITGSNSVTVDVNTMPVVATPVITPTPSGLFPVTVTITCATPGATIYYTLDGTLPNETSPIYSGPFTLYTITQVRAWAVRAWSVQSGFAAALFGNEQPAAGTTLGRTITFNSTPAPLIQIAVQPGAAVKCYAVSESVPAGLTPQQITSNGVFSATTRTIRWGPFRDAQARTLGYRLSGADGNYPLAGIGSFDGFGQVTPGEPMVTVDNHPFLTHSVTSNWTFSVSVVVTAAPPASATCYTVEEFLPAGLAPSFINGGGVWNSNTLAIKWGPFLDNTARVLSFYPTGAFTSFATSGRMSVDGVSQTWNGDATVSVGVPVPQNLAGTPGNQTIYLNWIGSGHETGYKLYYWTKTNRSDQLVVSVGTGTPVAYTLSGLQNGTNYLLAVSALDSNGVESAQSGIVTNKPLGSAGLAGVVMFDSSLYANTNSVAVVSLFDADLNTNTNTLQTAFVQVSSDSDTVGFALLLKETGTNTGVFTSAANGTNLSFTLGTTQPGLARLKVTGGDAVRAIYQDALPAGQRQATAQFGQLDNPALYITSIQVMTPGTVVLQWNSAPGRTYAVEKSFDLAEGFYEWISDLPSTPPVNTYVDSAEPGFTAAFYRIRLQP